MIAYDETYLSGAQKRLGAFLDFATSGLGLNLTDAHAAFLASPLSRRFAAGDPAVVAGRSGEELALDILGSGESSEAGVTDVIRTRKPREIPSATSWVPHESASPEYWTGWALAFYQWASGYAFEAIDERVCIADIRSLYMPYHEMDVRQFCDRLDEMAQRMTTEIVAVRDDELRLFASSWRSDAADKLAGKYQLYFGELTDVRNEIAAAAEEIRRVSRRMFFGWSPYSERSWIT